MRFALWLMNMSIFDQLPSAKAAVQLPEVSVGLGVLLLWAGFACAPQPLSLRTFLANHHCLLMG